MLSKIMDAFSKGKVRWRSHAQQRMLERAIHRIDVEKVVSGGRVIEEYTSNKPYPCFLISGKTDGRHIHVLVGFDKDEKIVYVITVYELDERHFESDLITRRKK